MDWQETTAKTKSVRNARLHTTGPGRPVNPIGPEGPLRAI